MVVDVWEMSVAPGDRLLLCSDGIHGVLTDVEIAGLVAVPGPLQDICHALIQQVNSRGGPDNATVVLIEVDGAGAV